MVATVRTVEVGRSLGSVTLVRSHVHAPLSKSRAVAPWAVAGKVRRPVTAMVSVVTVVHCECPSTWTMLAVQTGPPGRGHGRAMPTVAAVMSGMWAKAATRPEPMVSERTLVAMKTVLPTTAE